jgi:acetolactate synthase I/II/III large subunit
LKVSDYVAEFISKLSPRCYTVCGAGAMHLNDSISHHPGIKSIPMHHEQAAAFAAEADARVTNNIGVLCVTCGPGGTNALTGIACAYVDSIPMLVIAGQVTSSTMAIGNARPSGMNELPLVDIVRPVSKFALTVREPERIRKILECAAYQARAERGGPIVLEIPLDVQCAEIEPDELEPWLRLDPIDLGMEEEIASAVSLLESAHSPVLLIGNGVRLSGAEEALRRFVSRFQMPVVASWGARDIWPDALGSCGIFGDRQSNWAVQNADLVLAVGTRLSYPQTGHHRDLFAPNARKIVVDIDHQETTKLKPDLAIVADAKAFLEAMNEAGDPVNHIVWESWGNACRSRVNDGVPCGIDAGIQAYAFIHELGKHLSDDAIIITDVGFAYITTFQSLKLKPAQRLIHSGGVSPMGWGIPAAVGAAFAAPGRQIVCLTGDGGAMMNLQELQTIAHHKLPISIFVYANNGYETIKIMQDNHFRRESVAGPESGLGFPDFEEIAHAFGLPCDRLNHPLHVKWALEEAAPQLIQLHMAPNQVIAPRVQSRMENGKFIPTPIDDMWPYREKAEAAE